MFRRLDPKPAGAVTLTIDGRVVAAAPGDSVMGAMLLADMPAARRSPADGSPRAPYCGMGICFECLVTIDGGPRRQACLTPVRDGMVVTTGIADD